MIRHARIRTSPIPLLAAFGRGDTKEKPCGRRSPPSHSVPHNHDHKTPSLVVSSPAEGELIRVSTGSERSLPVTTQEELVSFAATVVSADRTRPFVIKADERARYERINSVLEALREARARNVFLLSDQETVD